MLSPVQQRLRLIYLAVLVSLGAIVYLPGISGPWLFDDYSNILRNTYIRITTLDVESLYHAAYSLRAGPLQRPIAMLSFALNYYFVGGFNDTTSYKLTNLAIHGINGLLIFWLVRLILARLDYRQAPDRSLASTSFNPDMKAALVALLWVVHPIQLTSVLYVVQRMAELSALFMLLGMIGYLKGRARIIDGRAYGLWLISVSLGATLTLGILSKENAVLLPVFVLVMEFVLFSEEAPWRHWPKLSSRAKYLILVFAVLSASILLAWFINYAASGYNGRNFTFAHRALTETRVLVYYISLILLPRINEFGLYHDDIALSTSLISPWTTLFSAGFLVSLLYAAYAVRKKHPLLSLGALWFFAGHLLESTIIPLEIAHEHRNYIASLGVLLCLFYFFSWAAGKYNNRKLWLLVPALITIFGGVTALRASQWSNELLLHTYEALHHPDSAIIQSSLAAELTKYGHYHEAREAMLAAARLNPDEASHLVWLHMLAARQKTSPDAEEQKRLLDLLATKPITPTTEMMISNVIGCMQSWCNSLQGHMEMWIKTILARGDIKDKSYYYYLLGITFTYQDRLDEASELFRLSHETDPRYLHPLFNLAAIYIHRGKVNEAEQTLEMLRKANTSNLHPRGKEINSLAVQINKLKQRAQTPPE